MSDAYHDTRLALDPKRGQVWRALWRYWFSKRIRPEDAVLDLGSGYGDFINSVTARRRVAVDMWPGLAEHVAPGVEPIIGPADRLETLDDGSIDYAFASNLFEHLTQEQFAATLAVLKRVLSAEGTLTIVQPNYRYAYREYFDDYTHVAVYSHISLADFLAAQGWEVTEVRPRFLPLTVKSRLPTWDALIGLYLLSPVKPMGKQMLLVARPRRAGGAA
ncbi:MAG TPA: class I SAM-dependent methyltransferase [Sphingobium sp.]|uniref:class I SAM-dependent methyltransferase n=1 Tax=Sphingobium sp. TaxID=1912891 RepID=UPI002ED246F5